MPSSRPWPMRASSCATAASSKTRSPFDQLRASPFDQLRASGKATARAEPVEARARGVAMMFVLRMAVRETRASWQRLLFFFVCIAVGVAAIVALRSVIQSVREVFGREAKALIAADVLVSSNADWTAEARRTIERRFAEYGAQQWTESIE